MRSGPDLINRLKSLTSSKNTKTPSSYARKKKREDQALINAFHDILRIGLDVFEELVSDDLGIEYANPKERKGYT